MQGRSGVSEDTKDRFVLDAGAVYANIDLAAFTDGATGDPFDAALENAIPLGATRGGNSFNPGRTLREIEVDGKLGPIRGFKRRDSVQPTLTTNLVEITLANLKRALAGAVDTAGTDHTILRGGEITDASYLDNIAIVTTYAGSDNPIIVGVENALVTDAPDFGTSDDDELVLAVTFTGHFAGAETDVEPWFLVHPGGESEPAA